MRDPVDLTERSSQSSRRTGIRSRRSRAPQRTSKSEIDPAVDLFAEASQPDMDAEKPEDDFVAAWEVLLDLARAKSAQRQI